AMPDREPRKQLTTPRKRRKGGKPEIPPPPPGFDKFPLFPHATKRWAKKILGKLHYFGPWHDPQGALNAYLKDKEALHSGRKPRPEATGMALDELCNGFLHAKKQLWDSGELTERTWRDYAAACKLLIAHFGRTRLAADLGPDDFAGLRAELARTRGPVTLGN